LEGSPFPNVLHLAVPSHPPGGRRPPVACPGHRSPGPRGGMRSPRRRPTRPPSVASPQASGGWTLRHPMRPLFLERGGEGGLARVGLRDNCRGGALGLIVGQRQGYGWSTARRPTGRDPRTAPSCPPIYVFPRPRDPFERWKVQEEEGESDSPLPPSPAQQDPCRNL